MRRSLVPAVAMAIAVAFIAVLAYGIDHQGENTSIDSQIAHGHLPPAPDAMVKLPLLGAGRMADIADYRGKVVVLNIFASWCQPCQGEAPTMYREQQTLAGRNATVLGVAFEDSTSDTANFMRQYHLTYPVLRDVNGAVVNGFGTDAVPETFVLDTSGHVVAVRREPVSSQWLAYAVKRAFAASATASAA